MKINITGASGAGSTTLGLALAEKLNIPYLDSDFFFWEQTKEPFTIRRDPELRNSLIAGAIAPHNAWILGGSVMDWDPLWTNTFNLVVFLYIPPALRLQRLAIREEERFGKAIYTDPHRAKQFREFTTWCAGYDDGSDRGRGRTLQAHLTWLAKVNCTVLKIEGDTTVNQRIELVMEAIAKM